MSAIALVSLVAATCTGCMGVGGSSQKSTRRSLWFDETSLIFYPSRYPEGNWSPEGIVVEDAWIDTPDGVRLHGWYAACERPRAMVLFCHGNAGNVTHRVDALKQLNSLGASALVFDYRGYGRSNGAPDEQGILVDARAARAWLAKRTGVLEREIVLMGESLGGGVAVDLAAKDGARGLILENTFSSIGDVAAHHVPWAPVRWMLRTRLDSKSKIGEYQGPLLQRHGDADNVVPFKLGQQLHAAANEPKRLVVVPGGGHNDPPTTEYLAALDTYLAELR